jgi:hypothetical protein
LNEFAAQHDAAACVIEDQGRLVPHARLADEYPAERSSAHRVHKKGMRWNGSNPHEEINEPFYLHLVALRVKNRNLANRGHATQRIFERSTNHTKAQSLSTSYAIIVIIIASAFLLYDRYCLSKKMTLLS